MEPKCRAFHYICNSTCYYFMQKLHYSLSENYAGENSYLECNVCKLLLTVTMELVTVFILLKRKNRLSCEIIFSEPGTAPWEEC